MRRSGFCFSHNPETREQFHEAAVKGGNTPKKSDLDLPPIALQDVSDVVKLLEEAVNLVRNGSMHTNTANCLGYLSGLALKAIEANGLKERVEAIEATLKSKNSV